MKKIKYIVLILLMVLTINVSAKGDECESAEYNRLKELAKKVEFDYDYKLIDNKAVFSITAVNLTDELKVLIINDYYSGDYRQFKDKGEHKGTLENFTEGEKITVTIKAYVPNWCSGKTITTKLVKLPYYNYYYDEEKCKGNEDFKYCKQLIDVKITQKDFDNQLAQFIKNREKNEQKNVEKAPEDNSELIKIIGLSAGGCVVVGVIVALLIKQKKKNSL